jgi:CDP-diacylglycerol--serine O-phosphatidyltransferase
MFTLGNAACGFAAIIKIASFVHSDGNMHFLVQASYLILLAMLFDAFDGKVARITKATSDFGGQLDSLADTVSFGIAPAALVAMWHSKLLAGSQTETLWAQMTWFFCLAYVLASLLRLARFNVENEPSDEAHMDFTGLPTPGAAGLVVSIVIFHDYMSLHARSDIVAGFHNAFGEEAIIALLNFARTVMPLLMIMLAFFMVSSRMRYAHVLNKFFREKKTFDYLTYLIFGLVLFAIVPQLALLVVFIIYVATGPVQLVVNYFRSKEPVAGVGGEDSFVR